MDQTCGMTSRCAEKTPVDDLLLRAVAAALLLLSRIGRKTKKKKNHIACLYSDGWVFSSLVHTIQQDFPIYSTWGRFRPLLSVELLLHSYILKRVGGLGNIVGSSQLNVYKFSNCCPFFLIQKC